MNWKTKWQKQYESYMDSVCKKRIDKNSKIHQYGVRKKNKNEFLQNVHHANRQIGINPNIGKVEPTLYDRVIMYRCFVVSRHNKIVYCIMDDHISVVDFWDCRRDPDALAAQVK